jgi:hypothetical protein
MLMFDEKMTKKKKVQMRKFMEFIYLLIIILQTSMRIASVKE